MPEQKPPALDRRRWVTGLGLLPLAVGLPGRAQQTGGACLDSVEWSSFTARHVLPEGRVVDPDAPQAPTTSQAQSHGLFFALVHNDRATFSTLLNWTEVNLAAGNLARQPVARQWGRAPAGGLGVLDRLPDAGADLWLSYTLSEAGRLWNEPGYQALGRGQLSMLARDQVGSPPGLGRMLLPGVRSANSGPVWQIDPGALPVQLLRRFQHADPAGPWAEIAANAVRMLNAVTPRGFAPDRCGWSSKDRAFVDDPVKGPVGGHDAIRNYLWAGMLHAQDPVRQTLLKTLYGPRRWLEQDKALPEYVATDTGVARGSGPIGFAGALLPYLKTQGLTHLLDVQLARVRRWTASAAQPNVPPLPASERMLLLFGLAWLDGRYAFGRNGELQTHWGLLCPTTQLA